MNQATAIDPRKSYLNLRWNIRDVDDMHKMCRAGLSEAEIARRFTKAGRLTSAIEVREIAERNGFYP